MKNGTLGTLAGIEGEGAAARLSVRLDDGRRVGFAVGAYGHIEHGYAATIHKAQGVTVERAHVLASGHMDRHAAYVALSRHREGVALHYGREEFADGAALARRLGRERLKDTSLDYGGPDAAERSVAAYAERRGLHPLAPASAIVVRREGQVPERQAEQPDPGRAPRELGPAAGVEPEAARRAAQWQREIAAGRAAFRERYQAERQRAAEAARLARERAEAEVAPLLPAHRDALGRDSLGRGTSPAEVAAAAERSPQVQERRRDLEVWLRQAYRDPEEARRRLAGLEAEGGGPEAARRALLEGGPELLGELRGKVG